jgi:PIN domain nuclease of toxin-antitoxin system
MTYVLDACAVIALLKEEAGFEKVRDLVHTADIGEAETVMSIVNLLEVYYGFAGADGFELATDKVNKIYNSSIQILDTISRPVLGIATRLKSAYPLSLADAVGLATAIDQGGQFVKRESLGTYIGYTVGYDHTGKAFAGKCTLAYGSYGHIVDDIGYHQFFYGSPGTYDGKGAVIFFHSDGKTALGEKGKG